jgi:predicted RNA-binding Zn ribbon-like protein
MKKEPEPTEPPWTEKLAPEHLTVIQEFVNTHAYGTFPEKLDGVTASRKWFREHDITISHLNDQTLAGLIDLRETLRAVLLSHAGHTDPTVASRRLQKTLQTANIGIRISDTGEAQISTQGSGVQHLTNKIAAAILTSTITGTWARLKACSNDECQVAFYDHSRNGTTRYCSTTICANRVRQRNFRNRNEDPN